ncbi:MAG: SusD/RagB family nutrient-binding outer membrane lipoprotein [Muribaculaceae bacterium]|nr:SusD/RagB family nutrient-binding outer membrane lipoprotein [Muribaculaceae bacterium]
MKLKYLAIALMTVAFTSCSEDVMDHINKDKGSPAAEIVSGKFIIPGAIMNTAFNTISGNYAWYISSFTEQEFGTGDNQLRRAELRDAGEIASSSCFNNEWNDTYLTMHSLWEVMQKCQKGGLDEGATDLLGMAQVLMALDLGILTDLHGDIPYSEALTGLNNLQPKVDKQEDIYKSIFKLLDDGIANLQQGGSYVGESDILFGGNTKRWIGLAYALKARYKLHLYYRDRNVLGEVIAAANAAIAAGFDEAKLDVFDGVTKDNPWTAYFYSRYYTGSSSTVANLMDERDDPRLDTYNIDFFGYDLCADPGDEEAAGLTYACNGPAWLDNGAAYIHVFSKSELYFILAEAKARLGQDASADFATAVKASILDFAKCDPGYSLLGYVYPLGIEEMVEEMGVEDMNGAEFVDMLADDYIASLPVTLEEIMVQKYLAQVRDEQIEAYNDIRRCKALGENHIALTNPKNNGPKGNAWPLRLPYGNSDVISNPSVREAFGTGNDAGMYIYTENVWWAGGSR